MATKLKGIRIPGMTENEKITGFGIKENPDDPSPIVVWKASAVLSYDGTISGATVTGLGEYENDTNYSVSFSANSKYVFTAKSATTTGNTGTWTESGSVTVQGVNYKTGLVYAGVADDDILFSVTSSHYRNVKIATGTGVKSVYLSKDVDGLTSLGSDLNVFDGIVYAFAVLDVGYKHNDGWSLVEGTSDTEDAVYRVAGNNGTTDYDFGTISATIKSFTVTWKYLSAYPNTWTTDVETYNYGSTPSHTNPSTVTSGKERKVFSGWSNKPSKVTADVTITATYTTQCNITITTTRCSANVEDGWRPINTTIITYTVNTNCAFNSTGTETTATDTVVLGTYDYGKSADYVNVTSLSGTNCTTSATTGWKAADDTISWTADTAYAFDTSNTSTKSITVVPGANTANASYVKRYTLTRSVSGVTEGYGTYTLSRTSSPYQGAGALSWSSNKATIYYGDVISCTHSASDNSSVTWDDWDISSVTAPKVTSTGDSTTGNITVTNQDDNKVELYYNTSNSTGGTTLSSGENVTKNSSKTKTGLSFSKTYYCSARRTKSRTGWHYTYSDDSTYNGTDGVTSNVTATIAFNRYVDTSDYETANIYSSVTSHTTAPRSTYTITWKHENGTKWEDETYNYGETPSHTADTKTNTAEYTYTWAGWTPTITTVKASKTYTASFTATAVKYTVAVTANSAAYLYGDIKLTTSPHSSYTPLPKTLYTAGSSTGFSGTNFHYGDVITWSTTTNYEGSSDPVSVVPQITVNAYNSVRLINNNNSDIWVHAYWKKSTTSSWTDLGTISSSSGSNYKDLTTESSTAYNFKFTYTSPVLDYYNVGCVKVNNTNVSSPYTVKSNVTFKPSNDYVSESGTTSCTKTNNATTPGTIGLVNAVSSTTAKQFRITVSRSGSYDRTIDFDFTRSNTAVSQPASLTLPASGVNSRTGSYYDRPSYWGSTASTIIYWTAYDRPMYYAPYSSSFTVTKQTSS